MKWDASRIFCLVNMPFRASPERTFPPSAVLLRCHGNPLFPSGPSHMPGFSESTHEPALVAHAPALREHSLPSVGSAHMDEIQMISLLSMIQWDNVNLLRRDILFCNVWSLMLE